MVQLPTDGPTCLKKVPRTMQLSLFGTYTYTVELCTKSRFKDRSALMFPLAILQRGTVCCSGSAP